MDVRPLYLEMVHQLDHVFGLARSVGYRFIALPVIPAIESYNHMVFGKRLGDAVGEPVAPRGPGVSVNQDDRRAFSHDVVVNLYAVGDREIGLGWLAVSGKYAGRD